MGKKMYASHGNTQSRGVAVRTHEIREVKYDPQGRYIISNKTQEDTKFTLCKYLCPK